MKAIKLVVSLLAITYALTQSTCESAINVSTYNDCANRATSSTSETCCFLLAYKDLSTECVDIATNDIISDIDSIEKKLKNKVYWSGVDSDSPIYKNYEDGVLLRCPHLHPQCIQNSAQTLTLALISFIFFFLF